MMLLGSGLYSEQWARWSRKNIFVQNASLLLIELRPKTEGNIQLLSEIRKSCMHTAICRADQSRWSLIQAFNSTASNVFLGSFKEWNRTTWEKMKPPMHVPSQFLWLLAKVKNAQIRQRRKNWNCCSLPLTQHCISVCGSCSICCEEELLEIANTTTMKKMKCSTRITVDNVKPLFSLFIIVLRWAPFSEVNTKIFWTAFPEVLLRAIVLHICKRQWLAPVKCEWTGTFSSPAYGILIMATFQWAFSQLKCSKWFQEHSVPSEQTQQQLTNPDCMLPKVYFVFFFPIISLHFEP